MTLGLELLIALLPSIAFWLMLHHLPWVAKELGLVIVNGEVLRGRDRGDGSYEILVRGTNEVYVVRAHACTFCHYLVLPRVACGCNIRTSRRHFLSQRATVLP